MKKKLTFRIFLPLLILLLSGYGKEVSVNFKNFAMNSVITASDFQFFQQDTSGIPTIKAGMPISRSTNVKVRLIDNEVDEDEVHVSNKQLTSNNYFDIFYQSISFGDKFNYFREKVNFKTVFYYLTTYKKHILFQVFRI